MEPDHAEFSRYFPNHVEVDDGEDRPAGATSDEVRARVATSDEVRARVGLGSGLQHLTR